MSMYTNLRNIFYFIGLSTLALLSFYVTWTLTSNGQASNIGKLLFASLSLPPLNILISFLVFLNYIHRAYPMHITYFWCVVYHVLALYSIFYYGQIWNCTKTVIQLRLRKYWQVFTSPNIYFALRQIIDINILANTERYFSIFANLQSKKQPFVLGKVLFWFELNFL